MKPSIKTLFLERRTVILMESDEEDDADTQSSLDDSIEDEEEYRPSTSRAAEEEPKQAKSAKKSPIERRLDVSDRLYDIVCLGEASFKAVVDQWIESYKLDRDSALLQLFQFFFRCSGCLVKVTPLMQRQLKNKEMMKQNIEEIDDFDEIFNGGYPIIDRHKQWTDFRNNLGGFIKVLVRQCQLSVIFDQYLMKNIMSFLICLSESHTRAFRHTSTLIVMKLMTGLVKFAWSLTNNLENIQQQYETERNKNKDKTTAERLELLLNKRKEAEKNSDEVKRMLDYLFTAVFLHRYRDKFNDIRSICIGEIGVWMLKFHRVYLDDSYLRYIGWSLNDRTVGVRLSCLQSLLPLYSLEQLAERLDTFTNQYKDRIVALTVDKRSRVASQAVKLLISILKYHKDSPMDKYFQHVYELVYSSNRAVAQTAGKFLNEQLFTLNKENLKTKEGKKRSINTPLIRDLVTFYIESEIHNHGAFLVDSLFESNPMMRDWKCMTDLLLEEPGPDEESLSERQETSLIDIMICCVRQAATGKIPVGRTSRHKVLMAKYAKQVIAEKDKLTVHFVTVLPQLIKKYLNDPEKVSNLLLILQYFNLSICKGGEMEEHLELLLEAISDMFSKHTELDVLETCLQTYDTLYRQCELLRSRCEDSRSLLIEPIIKEYLQIVEVYQPLVASVTTRKTIEGEDLDDVEVSGMTSNLKKVRHLYSYCDLSEWKLWESLLDWVRLGNIVEDIPQDIVQHCISSCVSALMWMLSKLNESKPTEVEINTSKERLFSFMNVCREMLNNPNYVFQAEAFNTICHLLVIYRKPRPAYIRQPMHSLFYDVDDDLKSQLMKFIQENVFVDVYEDSHPKMEELPRRRRLLTSFCKLVCKNVIRVRDAADIFKHLQKCFDDYGDIIKSTIKDAMEINNLNCVRTMGLSLLRLFKELRSGPGATFDRKSPAFASIKKLATRFSSCLGGVGKVNNSDAAVALHRDCIVISASMENSPDPGLPPPNLAFLDILRHFTRNLTMKNKDAILSFLDQRLPPNPLWRGDQWQPYDIYRNSLLPEQDDSESNEEDEVESEDNDSDHSDDKRPSPASGTTRKHKPHVELPESVRKKRKHSQKLRTIEEENGINNGKENEPRYQTRQRTSGTVRSIHFDGSSEEDFE